MKNHKNIPMNTFYFSTLQELKSNSSKFQSEDLCETFGYYNQFDGGSGKYLILTDSTSTDDGGYIIRLNQNLIAKLIIFNNEINALQYGAHPNWSQYPNEPDPEDWAYYDNKNIFSKLIKCASQLHCNVYIPEGTYLCIPTKREDTLLPVASNIILRGDRYRTIITLPTLDETNPSITNYSPLLRIYNSHQVLIKDIVLDGNRHIKSDGSFFGGNDQFGVWGAEIGEVQDVYLENVICQNCMYAGFRISGNSKKVTFRFCQSIMTDCGFITMGQTSVSDLTISNCLVDGHNQSEGISLYHQKQGYNIQIIDNTIKNKENAIGINIGFDHPTFSIENGYWNENIIIANNIISNLSAGISIRYAAHIQVQGNLIKDIGADGIAINTAQDISVCNNQIYNCDFRNLSIMNSKHLTICNNLLKDNSCSRSEVSIAVSFIYAQNCSCVNIHNNHIYQEKTSVRKLIHFNTDCSDISFIGNETFQDIEREVSKDTNIQVFIEGNNENNCLKDSYIELPLHSDYYHSYPAKYGNERNHSNYIGKRKEEITKNYYDSTWSELANCCIVDPLCQQISHLVLRPPHTKVALYFCPNRAFDTQLVTGGNIYFTTHNAIPKDERWIMEFICMEDHWVETTRKHLI